jgi:hypothetical protein
LRHWLHEKLLPPNIKKCDNLYPVKGEKDSKLQYRLRLYTFEEVLNSSLSVKGQVTPFPSRNPQFSEVHTDHLRQLVMLDGTCPLMHSCDSIEAERKQRRALVYGLLLDNRRRIPRQNLRLNQRLGSYRWVNEANELEALSVVPSEAKIVIE